MKKLTEWLGWLFRPTLCMCEGTLFAQHNGTCSVCARPFPADARLFQPEPITISPEEDEDIEEIARGIRAAMHDALHDGRVNQTGYNFTNKDAARVAFTIMIERGYRKV